MKIWYARLSNLNIYNDDDNNAYRGCIFLMNASKSFVYGWKVHVLPRVVHVDVLVFSFPLTTPAIAAFKMCVPAWHLNRMAFNVERVGNTHNPSQQPSSSIFDGKNMQPAFSLMDARRIIYTRHTYAQTLTIAYIHIDNIDNIDNM